ncbi:Gfo/Idh/MocA family protein [Rathayibacter sp. VKM Ac-2857]|uniref:Gfo/Idh/MocA family protein n=1 Tax=Rathayibacter sp. VKM Ac-2857 TaxID=2739020 RepID=UPI00156621F3|nr:Gfo/Idh/MocA family oxidoreductase [Rathayibacter sp. VKM Ac-2857]NQX16865.1 Gfo/Idh/MocA family oxidoreductase [Rathayibacter sp. VKM Ac-2857]
MSTTPPRTIGVGLISVGWMGRLHSRAYNALPLIYPELGLAPRLVQAADVAQSGRDYAQDVLGYETTTADYHDVLANPEVDVVSICAPNFLHAEVGIAAAKAGKPFWIEKPVGRSGTETRAVEAAADEAGVVTCIGFNYRHVPAVELIKSMIADGALGRITNVRGRFFGGFSSDPADPLAWRFVRSMSGSGVLGDLMGHLVDLVHHVLGPIASVTASTGTYLTERPPLPGSGSTAPLPVENEDYANMLIRFHDDAVGAGALGTLEASRIAVGSSSDYSIEINGTEGSVRWNFARMNELDVALTRTGPFVGFTTVLANKDFPEFARFQPSAGTGMGYDDLKTIEAKKFLLAVTGGSAESSNIHDAVASAQVLDAAEASAAAGTWVATPLVAGTTAAFAR